MSATCHCGRPAIRSISPDPWEGRLDGYCDDCATNRCDCYPDVCPVKYPPQPLPARIAEANEVCGCLDEHGYRHVRLYERCQACGTFMQADFLADQLARAHAALHEIVMAEPNETGRGTAWPSFAGTLQNIAAQALADFDRGEQ